jgi:hypothetical protein
MPATALHDSRAFDASSRKKDEQHKHLVEDKLESKGLARRERHPGACQRLVNVCCSR